MQAFEPMVMVLGELVVVAPLLVLVIIGLSSLFEAGLSEQSIHRITMAGIVSGLSASLAMLAFMLITGTRHIVIDFGDWIHTSAFHLSLAFVFDRLSVPFAILSFTLAGTIGAFAVRYMHRDRGFRRFFLLYAVFLLGMVCTSLADTIETLFVGWELVGLSSALLVAFFQDRPSPPRNGLWVWSIYRVSDAAILLAAVVMHHSAGEGKFDEVLGSASWPGGHAGLSGFTAVVVGLLLVIAAAGKSGLVPFSGWLPRAMEGPTPSSAVFYGALSVHLGAFLLLRVSPILDSSPWLSALIVVLGLATSVWAYLASSVQTDIKSALSLAALVQVGIIVVEIGLGFRYLALIHVLGHACMRTLQFIRAPSLLHSYHLIENAIGARLPTTASLVDRVRSDSTREWLYRFALERGYLDSILRQYVAEPFLLVFRTCDQWERRWIRMLGGRPWMRASVRRPPVEVVEELA